MFHEAVEVKFLKGVTVEVSFIDGKVFQFDISRMFSMYPQLEELKRNRRLFESGHLDAGGYAIVWNDELDIDTSDIYEEGIFVKQLEISLNNQIGSLLAKEREKQNLTQVDLARLSHIDQGDISDIERGKGNPTIGKLNRLFQAMGKSIEIRVK